MKNKTKAIKKNEYDDARRLLIQVNELIQRNEYLIGVIEKQEKIIREDRKYLMIFWEHHKGRLPPIKKDS